MGPTSRAHRRRKIVIWALSVALLVSVLLNVAQGVVYSRDAKEAIAEMRKMAKELNEAYDILIRAIEDGNN
jgi:ferric-dicitrate binding protein FerR (iron transport regulator)